MRSIILLRRVVGGSMSPRLEPGKLVLGVGIFRSVSPGQVVIFEHDGKQKIKRIERVKDDRLFLIGDNLAASTDSRHFGWLPRGNIVAKVVWPKL